MEEVDNLVKYIKDTFDEKLIKVMYYIYKTNILTISMRKDRVKEGDKIVEKDTSILETSYLRLCSQDFEKDYDIMGELFLHYYDYILRDLRAYWRFDLNKIDKDLPLKCTYCKASYLKLCPMKALGYIKKCIEDSNANEDEVFDRLIQKDNKDYNKDKQNIKQVADKILEITKDKIDISAIEFILRTDALKIIKEENGKIYYKYMDFKIKDIDFIKNIYDYFIMDKGLEGELDLSNLNISENYSYMFNKSPIELSAYTKYLCDKHNIFVDDLLKELYSRTKSKENVIKIAYYNEYVQKLNRLECSEKVKTEIKNILTYVRNYDNNNDLPYIQFNIELFTKNNIITNDIINILNKYMRTYSYLSNKNLLFVDVDMLIKRTKDCNDVFYQLDKIYNENDFIVFNNFDNIKYLNEFRVEAFFTSIEKYYSRNKRICTIFVGNKEIIEELTRKHPLISDIIMNKKIEIEELDVEIVKEKIIKKLSKIADLNDEFKLELGKYVENTYISSRFDENKYIQNVCDEVIFNKFKVLNSGKKLQKDEIPELTEVRNVEEILEDINGLVGITEVKYKITELLKYIEYSKKIDTEGFVNLNMIFKGNSGTGKTTVARLLAELFYKLGFISKNNIIEVTSKDLIGDHLGQTAPKTQAVIDAALDGVLFIDEAYTIMSSKGTADYASECISTICKAMELYKDRLIIIFAGYTKEMNDFINKNQGLMSRIGYEIEFPDFSKEELWQIFKDEVQGNEFLLEDGVEEKIKHIINKNKIGRNFGNARFMVNLFDKLVLTHAVECKEDEKLKLITKKDVDKFLETKKDKNRTIDEILNELNSLIGLKDIKEIINGFVSVIELNRKLERQTDFNMHMIFKGNAGTGKTTVARLIAEIYYNLGYINRNKLVEVQSQDLIGEYVGQTGPKTQAVIESALDGVLFIDEAYSIMEHQGTNASFTDECIATLLKAMEDYQGRLIIIFAGYTEEMKKFRDLNPGLKSRVGFELTFKDYSIDELVEIFNKKLNEKNFKIDEKGEAKIRNILEEAKKVENFGNGRFVENTIQKIIVEHAIMTRNIDDMERLLTITEEDIKDIRPEESKNRIGF